MQRVQYSSRLVSQPDAWFETSPVTFQSRGPNAAGRRGKGLASHTYSCSPAWFPACLYTSKAVCPARSAVELVSVLQYITQAAPPYTRHKPLACRGGKKCGDSINPIRPIIAGPDSPGANKEDCLGGGFLECHAAYS